MADNNTAGMDANCQSAKQDEAGHVDAKIKEEADTELDDILDSALEDFDKPPPKAADLAPQPQVDSAQNAAPKDPAGGAAASGAGEEQPSEEAMFEQYFQQAMSGEGGTDINQFMQQIMGGEPQLAQQFAHLGESMLKAGQGAEGQQQFEEALQHTMGSLSENAEQLQNTMPDNELAQMLSSLGLQEGGAGMEEMLGGGGLNEDPGFASVMQGVMKNLLSKDVLYPSLKEISSKYPGWLEENKSKLSTDEYTKYSKQYTLMTEILTEFEGESATESAAQKSKRFERIMDTMQSMQELGQPPKDIVGDMPMGFPMDGSGMPSFPGMGATPEQCVVM